MSEKLSVMYSVFRESENENDDKSFSDKKNKSQDQDTTKNSPKFKHVVTQIDSTHESDI